MLRQKKIMFLLAFVSLFMLVSMIQDSYAKYVSQATANGNFTIAGWNFQVNNQDVLANNDFSNVMIPTLVKNENIVDGVLAPTSEGYFDLVIDSSSVDVSFTETIVLSQSDLNTISDLQITGYSINGGNVLPLNDSKTISTDRFITDTNKINTYRIYVNWMDGVDEIMDNASDTASTLNGNASIEVNLSFIQKT